MEELVDVTVLVDSISDGRVVIAAVRAVAEESRPLERPGDDVEAEFLGLLSIGTRDDVLVLVESDEVLKRRSDDTDTVGCALSELLSGDGECLRSLALRVEEDGLLAKLGLVLDPVQDVIVEEGLGEHARGMNASSLVLVNHLLGVLLLGVVTLEGHGDFGGLELGGEAKTEALDEFNVLLVRQDGGAGSVQIRLMAGGATEELLRGGGRLVRAVHLGAERLVLGEGDVAGAALGAGRLAVGSRSEGLGALGVELGNGDDVSGGRQVALGVTADEFPVLGEGNVALEDTGTHASAGHVGLKAVLGHHEGTTTTVGDAPDRRLEGLLAHARGELLLEGPSFQVIDEEEGTRTQLGGLDYSSRGLAGRRLVGRRGSGQAEAERKGGVLQLHLLLLMMSQVGILKLE